MDQFDQWNTCSSWQERGCPGDGKVEGELFIPREELFIPWSNDCLAEAVGRGQAVRPRNGKFLSWIEKEAQDFFIPRTNFSSCHKDAFFLWVGL